MNTQGEDSITKNKVPIKNSVSTPKTWIARKRPPPQRLDANIVNRLVELTTCKDFPPEDATSPPN